MRRAGSPTLAIGLKINPYEYRCNHRASPTLILEGDAVPRYDGGRVRRDAPERTDPRPYPLRCDPGPPLQPDLRLAQAAPDSYPTSPDYHAGGADRTLSWTLLDSWCLHRQVQWGYWILHKQAERSGEQPSGRGQESGNFEG